MSLALSSSQSSVLEPMRKNRFVIQFKSIPGGGSRDNLAFVVKNTNAPVITYTAKEYDRINEKFYVAGKPVWNELTIGFYDFIQGTDSAASIMDNWSRSIYNPITGQMFFKKQYSTSATLAQLDPAGGVVRTWNYFYIWPQSITYGEGLDSSSDDLCEVTCVFRYDLAVKGTDVNTTPS